MIGPALLQNQPWSSYVAAMKQGSLKNGSLGGNGNRTSGRFPSNDTAPSYVSPNREHSLYVIGDTRAAQPCSGVRGRGRTPWGSIPKMRIATDQFSALWAGLGHAERLGLRPNWTLDIHYGRGELADPYLYWSESLQCFLRLIRDWVRSHGERTAYLYATEHRMGVGATGIHTHLLIHVPPRLSNRFGQLIRKWGRAAGLVMKQPSKVMNPHKIGGGVPTLKAAAGKLRYLCKDLESEGLELMAPFKRLNGKPQIHDCGAPSNGGVLGKKVGVSRNIDAKARRDYVHPPGAPTIWISADGRKPQIDNDKHILVAAAA